MLIIRGMIGGIAQLGFFVALLIMPAGFVAGEWAWFRAWLLIGAYGVVMLSSVVAMALLAPASLEARLRPPASKKQPIEDRIATTMLITALVVFFLFIPFDVFSWRLLGQPSQAVSAFGAALVAIGYGLIIWTIWINSFAMPIVEDQRSRGQRLIETGPYAVVRHPMYLGFLPFLSGIGLWLGSWASVPLSTIVIAALVFRITVEERMLLATLDGYEEYCARHRYRLLPGIW